MIYFLIFLDECKGGHDMQEVIAIFIVFIFLKLKIKNKIGQNMHIKYFYLFDNHSLKQR
jgi:hypothetical protein